MFLDLAKGPELVCSEVSSGEICNASSDSLDFLAPDTRLFSDFALQWRLTLPANRPNLAHEPDFQVGALRGKSLVMSHLRR